jgi:hypothetical protein
VNDCKIFFHDGFSAVTKGKVRFIITVWKLKATPREKSAVPDKYKDGMIGSSLDRGAK